MRIGIVTYWKTYDNYGTVLQYYALQTYLQKMGHEPYLIRDDFKEDISLINRVKRIIQSRGLKFFFKVCLSKIINIIFGRCLSDKRMFADFRKRYFCFSDRIYTSYREIIESPPPADIYIVGSDQPWNFYGEDIEKIKDKIHYYFLDFGPVNVKRISCAVSFGVPEIYPAHKCIIQNLLKRFNFISVREEFGIKLCSSLGFDNAVLQRDPTLFLAKTDYKTLYKNTFIEKPFILLYLLDNTTDFSVLKLAEWAKRNNLKIKYVSGNSWMRKKASYHLTNATVPDFLRLIDNASFVFTNSYHGVLFSVIYEKKFLYIKQTGEFQSQNDRLFEFLDYLEINDRVFSEDFNAVDNDIDYLRIKNILNETRMNSEFVKYLNEL